jgi:hypothetical protein
MAEHHPASAPPADSGQSLAQRLERGEVIYFPSCPFSLPKEDDLRFLLGQRLASRAHKNISYDPRTGRTGGFLHQDGAQAQRLQSLLGAFSHAATEWAARALPDYAKGWRLDQVSFRPEEEATRKLRQKARNDLLHLDAFPSRPTNGYRILRVFANINPTEPRVWVTSDPFAKLFARYGPQVGLPVGNNTSWAQRLGNGMLGIFQPARRRRSTYDAFMLRFHDFLKANDDFQEHCPKRFWNFQSGSAWMVMTDTASHAALRGRYALEHSYFVAPHTLALPAESPPVLLEKACGSQVLKRAA